MGDAAGQLADRLQLLGLMQGAFRLLAALCLIVEAAGAAHRDPQHGEQQQRGGQPENQVRAHGAEPFVLDRRGAGARERVDRKAFEFAKADAPRNAVDLGIDGEDAAGGAVLDRKTQPAARAQELRAIASRKPRQDRTVLANQGVETAGRLADQSVEVLEIFRPYRHRDHAVEGAVRRFQATRQIEEIAADHRQVRRPHAAHISAGVVGDLGAEIIAIGEVDVGLHRFQRARGDRPAVAPDQDDGLQLRHDVDDAGQPRMQARLRAADLVVRHTAHDFVDFRKGAVDGFENLERLLLLHVERAHDSFVGLGVNGAIADPGRIGIQRRRQHQRRDHHQFQQPDRRFPFAVHRIRIPAQTTRTNCGTFPQFYGANEAIGAGLDCNFVIGAARCRGKNPLILLQFAAAPGTSRSRRSAPAPRCR